MRGLLRQARRRLSFSVLQHSNVGGARVTQHLPGLSAAPCRRGRVSQCVVAGLQYAPSPSVTQTRQYSGHAASTSAPSAPPWTAPQHPTSLSSVDLGVDAPIAYEVLQGPLVRWSTIKDRQPPTAVLVHGILGRRQNLQSFARMLVEAFPAWQILLVDLRCHGESAALPLQPQTPHNVASAAADVLKALRQLALFPQVLIGHSFGGKVVMSMVQQFGATRLPRPVKVWSLDSLPGEVRSGDESGKDHPGRLIEALRQLPMPVASRYDVITKLEAAGFSRHISQWIGTNLKPTPGSTNNGTAHLTWTFDVEGIAQMYESYENFSLWPLLESPPQGLKLDFVRAEGSTFRWGGPDEARIKALGHDVHLLHGAGHWVHTDQPKGLLNIMSPSFLGADLAAARR